MPPRKVEPVEEPVVAPVVVRKRKRSDVKFESAIEFLCSVDSDEADVAFELVAVVWNVPRELIDKHVAVWRFLNGDDPSQVGLPF